MTLISEQGFASLKGRHTTNVNTQYTTTHSRTHLQLIHMALSKRGEEDLKEVSEQPESPGHTH